MCSEDATIAIVGIMKELSILQAKLCPDVGADLQCEVGSVF